MMKKTFLTPMAVLVAAFVLCMSMAACRPSTNRLIDRLETAIEKQNYGEAAELFDQLQDRRLTDEQEARIERAITHAGIPMLQNLGSQYLQMLGNLFTEDRVDKMQRAGQKAMSEMQDEFDDLFKDLDESLDDYLNED